MKSDQIKHSLAVGPKSIQSRVYDRETGELISFVKMLLEETGLVSREALAEQPAHVAAINTSSERVDKTEENVHEKPAQQLEHVIDCPRCGHCCPQPAQQHIEHCIWARNGNAPCPHVQPAQQEPVANVSAWFALVMNAAAELEDASNCLRDEDAKRVAIRGAKYYRDAANALYTSPQPSKPWVGLTDDEIDECYYWKDRQWTTDELVRHVEAKLREKNA